MKIIPLVIALWMLSGAYQVAIAYDLETRDGRVYKDIRLREKNDIGIRIAHQDGNVFLDYSSIPVPDLWTFGFDKDKYNTAKGDGEAFDGGTARPTGSSRLYRSLTPPPKTLSSSRPISSIRHDTYDVEAADPKPTTGGHYNSQGSSGTTRSSYSSGASRQCSGYTQKGYRCKRMVKGGSYCYQHG